MTDDLSDGTGIDAGPSTSGDGKQFYTVTKADASAKVGVVLIDSTRGGATCTVVHEVKQGGLAEQVGLPLGAVVVSVNGLAVTGTYQALDLLRAAAGDVVIGVVPMVGNDERAPKAEVLFR